MEKTIWKRVGGWIKGNRYSKVGDEVSHVDAEGMLVEMADGDDPIVKKKLGPMGAVEEGFSKLTDVIREMNDNVSQHREQAADLNRKVTTLVEALPEGLLKQNKTMSEMAEQLKVQALRHEQVAELLKSLPDNSKDQLEQLNRIGVAVESNQSSQAQAFDQFNTTVKTVSESSQAQAASLANIGQMLEANEKHLQEMIDIQNKRFGKLFASTLFLAVVALGSVASVLWLVLELQKNS